MASDLYYIASWKWINYNTDSISCVVKWLTLSKLSNDVLFVSLWLSVPKMLLLALLLKVGEFLVAWTNTISADTEYLLCTQILSKKYIIERWLGQLIMQMALKKQLKASLRN